MTEASQIIAPKQKRRMSKTDRRRQLLETALAVIRSEGADRLTLGYLATRSGISKPVVYDHFGTRSGLLIALYRWIDSERIDAFQAAMATAPRDFDTTVGLLAEAYVLCAADLTGEFHIVGAALAGSPEKAEVFAELLDQSVAMFVAILQPFSNTSEDLTKCRCIALVGAGEGLSAAIVRGKIKEKEAISTFAAVIRSSIAEF